MVYLVKVHMSYTPPEKKVCPCRHLHQRASLGLRRLMSMREITHRCFIRRHLHQLEQPAIPRPSGDFRDRPGIDARPSSDWGHPTGAALHALTVGFLRARRKGVAAG